MTGAAAYPTATIRDAELFEVGDHRGQPYTLADLRDMVRNFRDGMGWVDPPIVIGHEERQPLVAGLAEGGGNTGDPAVGWVTSLRLGRRAGRDGKPRWVLLFSGHGIHPTVAGLINRRAYRKVSAEVYDDPPDGAPPSCRGKMLRRVALLGGELPQIKTLADLPAATFAETPYRAAALRFTTRQRSPDGKAWRVFSEVIPMDRATLEDQLRGLGWSDAMIEAVKGLPDPDFAALANAALAQAAGVDAGGGTGSDTVTPTDTTGGGGGGATGMADSTMPPRDQMISDLVAAGEDENSLQGMTDQELYALWQTKVGGAGGGGGNMGPNMMGELRKFSEQLKAELRKEVGSVRAQVAALHVDASRRKSAERSSAVKAFCERWVRDGFVLPAEVDPASATPNLYHRLMNADGVRVRKYGEKGPSLSDFDAAVAEVEARGPGWAGRRGERLPDPQADQKKNLFQQIREKRLTELEARRKQQGPSLEERLNMLPSRSQQ